VDIIESCVGVYVRVRSKQGGLQLDWKVDIGPRLVWVYQFESWQVRSYSLSFDSAHSLNGISTVSIKYYARLWDIVIRVACEEGDTGLGD